MLTFQTLPFVLEWFVWRSLALDNVLFRRRIDALVLMTMTVRPAGHDGRWDPHGALDDSRHIYDAGLESALRRRSRSGHTVARPANPQRIHRLLAEGQSWPAVYRRPQSIEANFRGRIDYLVTAIRRLRVLIAIEPSRNLLRKPYLKSMRDVKKPQLA